LVVTSFGSLQNFPFVNTAERKNFNNKKWTFFMIINGLIRCDAEMKKGHQNVVVKTIEIRKRIEVSTSRRGIISCAQHKSLAEEKGHRQRQLGSIPNTTRQPLRGN
jgi:hypothetical protein